MSDEQDTKKLIAELGDKGASETNKLHALRELGTMRKGKTAKTIITHLRDSSKAVQEAACDTLASMGGEEAVSQLVPLLEEENAQLRNLAIQVLGRIGNTAPEVLYSVFETGSDDAKIFTLDIFGVLEYEPAIEPMAVTLDSSNVNVRNACVMAMGRIASPTAIPYFLKALEDDEWIRFSAIEGLSRCGDPSVISALVDKLREARNEPYYPAILECFSEIRRIETVEPLFQELVETQPRYRTDIIAALVDLLQLEGALNAVDAELRTRIRPILIEETQHENPWAAFRALDVIRYLGDRDYAPTLLEVLEKGNELAQAGAVRALEAIAISGDLSRLKAARREDLAVQDELNALIDRLEKE